MRYAFQAATGAGFMQHTDGTTIRPDRPQYGRVCTTTRGAFDCMNPRSVATPLVNWPAFYVHAAETASGGHEPEI
jgi:hypothetical protein